MRPGTGRRVAAPRPRSGAEQEHLLVVAVGASAGGLDACAKLLTALPVGNGMAFVIVQHLDPTHDSMMAELLAERTTMTVRQATDGMPIERERVYVIPPGSYLSVQAGALRLSPPDARHGARLPFDFLLRSLAKEYGARAICVVLSGTGADGSLGARAVKEGGGLVIAQDPAEADFDGMPRSAIASGAVDAVLRVAEIPDALAKYQRYATLVPPQDAASAMEALPQIVALLRAKTAHDFTLYKPDTLARRIQRRMGLAGIEGMARYLDQLRGDAGELELLAKDLLINVTSFFRDREVFDLLAQKTIPDLIEAHAIDAPVRLWIAGCSTGEETYSLAMLFREQIAASKRGLKLQVFASDVDADAVARAREGLYPLTIEADVSPARLARFFTKDEHGYRVTPELRAAVVFAVQDVLADPPFSRLDMVSCRNLLIYLRPEAQAKVISLFHFALCEGGLLLLGGAETIAANDDRFEVISKSERLFRRIGQTRPGDIGFPIGRGGSLRARAPRGLSLASSGQATLPELCRRLVLENYAPAAALINGKEEALYTLGPIDRYLSVAPGAPTHDLIAMARPAVRAKLRAAIQQAARAKGRVVVAGGHTTREGESVHFSIAAQPVVSEGEALMLICFVEEPARSQKGAARDSARQTPRVDELEQELAATQLELQSAVHNLEIATEEQRVINEEALSVNEEYQSTNEELLTSKEELQSLNEELTALNGQLQETLERQRTTANDLQNVLYSTDVATLFLDADLKIRFFTPATRSIFSIIASDIGRPLADLRALVVDDALLGDAAAVLKNSAPVEREIEAESGSRYLRRAMPYRSEGDGAAGVVITFADVTERAIAADALEAAKRQAQQANAAKSRFLAAASHDLRQPLQTLALLQGLLAKAVEGEKGQQLVARIDEALGAMSAMLNALFDINQIEAGAVRANVVSFPINDLFERLRDEFAYHAHAQGLVLRVVRCGVSIQSDPRLLEQMIRNLLSNAMKYTKSGKVLLGCRRRGEMLSIEVWDTGAGIPSDELQAIFEEYHQLGNAARERSRGFGLGLAIVQRLGNLLGHPIRVHSEPGRGSVFAIEAMIAKSQPTAALAQQKSDAESGGAASVRRAGAVLVIEDEPELRDLLALLLKDEGHHAATASDGAEALALAAKGTIRPDLILADYNLPNGMDGLQSAAKLRESLRRHVPVIILTGDISTAALREIARQDCVQLNKPVKAQELTQVIQRLLAAAPAPRVRAPKAAAGSGPIIFVVDDDRYVRDAIRAVLEDDGRVVEDYATCEAFLDAYRPTREACLLIDAYLPGMSGVELLQRLKGSGDALPAIMITGNSDVAMAVQAMKAGALDFIEKPIGPSELLASVARALEQARDSGKLSAWREKAAKQLSDLTLREREIMELVLAGHASKNIAAQLGISQRTVENHRAAIMKKTGSTSLPALARLALTAAWKRAAPLK